MIRKTIQTICLLLISTAATFAQKPSAGNFSTELIVNPFSGAAFLTNANGGLKLRYFLSEKTALRVGFAVNAFTTVDKYNNPVTSQDDGEAKLNNINLLFLPGLEFHFTGTEKLSPYIGFDIGAGYYKTKETLTNIDEGHSYREDYGRERSTSGLSYNFDLVLGADYYVAPKLFIGGEFGFRASYLQVLTAKTTYTGTAVSPFTPPRATPDSNFSLSSLAVSGLRLGFVF